MSAAPSKLSVIMPVWNGQAHVHESIQSLLAQTFGEFELLVVDDGSTDDTVEIVSSFSDSRVRLIRREHGGIVAALNAGVEESACAWIARQDADDLSEPTRFARQVAAIGSHPSAVLCYSGTRCFGPASAGVRPAHVPRTRALLALQLCFRCPISHSTVMFSKDTFCAAGRYLERERHAEDYGLWGRMLSLGDTVCVPRPLVRMRLHEGAISRRASSAQADVARGLAVHHARQFLKLDDARAERASRILSTRPAERRVRDWIWVIAAAHRSLPWKSTEVYLWLAAQALRGLLPAGRRGPGREEG